MASVRTVGVLVLFLTFHIAFIYSLCTSRAPSVQNDRRPNGSILRVATYNAEWLFLANDASGDCPPAGCQYPTISAAMNHLIAVAVEIIDINADIIVLEEVEGCETMDVLNTEIGLAFGYNAYLVPGTDTYTGQNVGILTRIDPSELERTNGRADFPINGNDCGANDQGDEGVSKNVYAKFTVNDTVIHLFGMHFLAYPDDRVRCLEREAQATVIVDFMQEKVTDENEQTIVLGDLNDYSSTMADAADSKPISRTLEFLQDGLEDLYGDSLVNVGTYDRQSSRYSSWWDQNRDCVSEQGELTAIDHLLISPGLNDIIDYAEYYHNYAATCDTIVSDHYAVVATFNFN